MEYSLQHPVRWRTRPIQWHRAESDFSIFLQGRNNGYGLIRGYKRTPTVTSFNTQALQEYTQLRHFATALFSDTSEIRALFWAFSCDKCVCTLVIFFLALCWSVCSSVCTLSNSCAQDGNFVSCTSTIDSNLWKFLAKWNHIDNVNTKLTCSLWFELMMSDFQRIASQVESWTNWGMSYYLMQPYLSACGAQVWSIVMVVDDEGEGHAGLCWWTRSGEGRALGLDWGTRVARWLATVADTWDTHRHEDVAEQALLPAWSRTTRTRVQDVGDVHVEQYSWQFGGWASRNHPTLRMEGLAEFGLKTWQWWFQQELEEARGVITRVVSRWSNFVWSAWPSNQYPKSWSILPPTGWICSMYLEVV
jgi:hypothetical protein